MGAIGDLANTPAVSARAVLLADAVTGTTLCEKRSREPLPPASTTKIMTALVALERGNLADLVTVPAEALEVGEASMGLVLGERLSVEDLLYGLLLTSGNDASVAIAMYIAGSVDGFVALMNERAETLGLEATHYANPHGLDAPGHLTSAADLLTVTRAALQYDEFARIVATPQATVAGRLLFNTNELLSTYDGANGVKTGTTDEAGQCVVAAASRNGGLAIAVVLGSEDRFSDAAALLDHYFANYAARELPLPRGRLAILRDSEGTRWSLLAGQQQSTLLPLWQWPWVRTIVSIDPDMLGSAKEPVGSVRYSIGQLLLQEVPLMGVARGE
jgi:D-alanyl-D-alanine carboxypeptidase (penicillin-binding protein 5/6)